MKIKKYINIYIIEFIIFIIVCFATVLITILILNKISYACTGIKKYKTTKILYTEEFNNDLDHIYQVRASADLNIRNGPGYNYNIIGIIKAQSPVDIVCDEEYSKNGWTKVLVNLEEGYVYDKYLIVIKRRINEPKG